MEEFIPDQCPCKKKSKLPLILIIVGVLAVLAVVFATVHFWSDATCTEPETCKLCRKTRGESLGHVWNEPVCNQAITCSRCGGTEGIVQAHQWTDATCTESKTCSLCGKTEGEPLGHYWQNPTCTVPRYCTICGKTVGNPLGHDWVDATCTEPQTCAVCGTTGYGALGHNWQEATCTNPKTCSTCGETEGEVQGHVLTGSGAIRTCSVCGKGVEYYYNAGGDVVYAWTEFEISGGRYINPVTYFHNYDPVVWMKDGVLQQWLSDDAYVHVFYVDGTIYYYAPYEYELSEAMADHLAITANRYVDFYQYWWGDEYLILLTGEDIWDGRGEAHMAQNSQGKAFVIVHKGNEDENIESGTWAVSSSYKLTPED